MYFKPWLGTSRPLRRPLGEGSAQMDMRGKDRKHGKGTWSMDRIGGNLEARILVDDKIHSVVRHDVPWERMACGVQERTSNLRVSESREVVKASFRAGAQGQGEHTCLFHSRSATSFCKKDEAVHPFADGARKTKRQTDNVASKKIRLKPGGKPAHNPNPDDLGYCIRRTRSWNPKATSACPTTPVKRLTTSSIRIADASHCASQESHPPRSPPASCPQFVRV